MLSKPLSWACDVKVKSPLLRITRWADPSERQRTGHWAGAEIQYIGANKLPVRQDEHEALSLMPAAGRAVSFIRTAIEEHGGALLAKSPGCLRRGCLLDVVRQDEHEALRLMPTAGRAVSFIRTAIEEHAVALLAKSPGRLCLGRLRHIMGQIEHEALGLVAAAGRAVSLVRTAIEEHGGALVAKSPMILTHNDCTPLKLLHRPI